MQQRSGWAHNPCTVRGVSGRAGGAWPRVWCAGVCILTQLHTVHTQTQTCSVSEYGSSMLRWHGFIGALVHAQQHCGCGYGPMSVYCSCCCMAWPAQSLHTLLAFRRLGMACVQLGLPGGVCRIRPGMDGLLQPTLPVIGLLGMQVHKMLAFQHPACGAPVRQPPLPLTASPSSSRQQLPWRSSGSCPEAMLGLQMS